MREIKFRAWDPKHKHMFIVKEFGFSENNTWCTSKRGGYRHWNAPMMQFTGLKDKNGKKIYEGDIVRHASDEGIYKVIFEDGGFYVESLIEHDFQRINEYPLEVIGNIYENPELLEGEE